jgi:hypothetical protein
MSSINQPKIGNAKKEGLGFDGFSSQKLKIKKLTKEKLVTKLNNED